LDYQQLDDQKYIQGQGASSSSSTGRVAEQQQLDDGVEWTVVVG
jgi:hypothetical protein